jgi:hypothetical protein
VDTLDATAPRSSSAAPPRLARTGRGPRAPGEERAPQARPGDGREPFDHVTALESMGVLHDCAASL